MICPFAIQHPGPTWKTNAGARLGKGAVLHSAEGSLQGALKVLESQVQSSWHFTISLYGTIFQHYPTGVQAWHAGPKANPYYVGIEHENEIGAGGVPLHTPFTAAQVDADRNLLRWLAEVEGWPNAEAGLLMPFVRHRTLFEHNEFMATACPSGRVPWDQLLAELKGDDVDAQKEKELDERRAKAILDLNLLLEYRTEFAGPPEFPTQAVTLRLNDGTYMLTVPTPRQP